MYFEQKFPEAKISYTEHYVGVKLNGGNNRCWFKRSGAKAFEFRFRKNINQKHLENNFVSCTVSSRIDDRVAVWDLVASYSNITMLEDKGYTKAALSADLKSEKGIELLPVQKNNSKVQFPKAIRLGGCKQG